MEQNKTITIPLSVYKSLCQDSRILAALEANGVDNWEWYSEALHDAGVFDDEDEDES